MIDFLIDVAVPRLIAAIALLGGGGVLVWAVKKVVAPLFIARKKPVESAKGAADVLDVRKKSVQEMGGLDDETAGHLALLESFPNEMRENVQDVIEKAKRESSSPDFEELLNARLDKGDSVSIRTLDAGRYTTADELRSVLGKILAMDVDKPGLIHPSTVRIASDLRPDELGVLLKLRAIAWTDSANPNSLHFLATPSDDPAESYRSLQLYAELGYNESIRLEELGLISRPRAVVREVNSDEMLESCELCRELGYVNHRLKNGTRQAQLVTNETRKMGLGRYHLTIEGREILKLYMDEPYTPRRAYFKAMCERWQGEGFRVSSAPHDPQHPVEGG